MDTQVGIIASRIKKNVKGADEHVEQAESVERSEEKRLCAQKVELSTRNHTLFGHASLPTVPSQNLTALAGRGRSPN